MPRNFGSSLAVLIALFGLDKANAFMPIGVPFFTTRRIVRASPCVFYMANHYSSIGMPIIRTVEDTKLVVARIAKDPNTDQIKVQNNGGHYLRWPSKSGAELWGAANARYQFVGFDPHYEGPSRMRVGITSTIGEELDGGFRGWTEDVTDLVPGSGNIEFHCPDYEKHKDLVLPSVATVQMAAFAHEIAIFDTIQDYKAANAQSDDAIKMASQSYAPASDVLKGDQAEHAVLSGHIFHAELKQNELTGKKFYWAQVRSVGDMEFDVVIDPELVEDEHPPRPGGVVKGYFWLSGRLVSSLEKTDGI